METGELIAYIVAGSAAAFALFKQLAPYFAEAKVKRDEVKLAAEIEDQRDRREDTQQMAKLKQAYYDAEQQVTHQMLTDLISRSFDEKAKSDEYVRVHLAKQLQYIQSQNTKQIELLSHFQELTVDQKTMKYELRNQATQMKILIGLISDIYEKNRQTDEIS